MGTLANGQALRAALGVRVVLLDGGLGSALLAAGLPSGAPPETWTLAQPERVAAVHRAFAEAGSDVVHTNTFGANPLRLADTGLAGRCGALNRAAVALARDTVGGRALVAGDIGPTGRRWPAGAPPTPLRAAYDAQAAALAEAGADLLSVETMLALVEARAALAAARATGLPVFVSLTVVVGPDGPRTLAGERIDEALAILADEGADAVGLNCIDSATMRVLVPAARAATRLPLVVQPNAGAPRATPAGPVYDAATPALVEDVVAMMGAGATVVGGCCGTDADFVRALRTALEASRWTRDRGSARCAP